MTPRKTFVPITQLMIHWIPMFNNITQFLALEAAL